MFFLRCCFLHGLLLIAGCEQAEEISPSPVARSAADSTPVTQTAENTDDLRELLDLSPSASNSAAEFLVPHFENLAGAARSGIEFQRFNDVVPGRFFLPEVMGGGVAWFDFDGDGLLDLYALNGCRLWEDQSSDALHVNRLYRNLGQAHFRDATALSGSGDASYGQGCAVGDYNADGFPDLYVTNYGSNALLINNGDGTFADATLFAEVESPEWSTSAVWFDANADGLADLYVVNYLELARSNHEVCDYEGEVGYCGPGQWNGVADRLYLNTADGRFQPVALADEIDPVAAKGLAVAVTDFNGDRNPDAYVANDMAPNFLLTKNEQSTAEAGYLFHNTAVLAGCAVSNEGRNEASMGVACADFDRDGLPDIFLTHFYEDKNTLYRNLGGLLFEDASRVSRVAATSFHTLGFGTVAFDANLDGTEDLFIANGHVLGPNLEPNEMQPQLLLNDGRGIFYDLSASCGAYFSEPCLGRGASGGDFDNDGRLDLAINHLDRPLALLHNQTKRANHFIGLELRPRNRVIPIGCQLVVTTSSQRRLVPLVAGGSYLSTHDSRLLIGLGSDDGPVEVSINWSEGESDEYSQLTPDRYWILAERQKAIPRSVPASRSLPPHDGGRP